MQPSDKPIHTIVVVGGGAAGWLTASILAAQNRDVQHGWNVVLVESPEVSILGVGEGTWPTMRGTLQKIGIDELSFLRQCDASFKQGTDFRNWQSDQQPHQYYHPFSLPLRFPETDVAALWQSVPERPDFAHLLSTQAHICDYHLAPKQVQTPAYAAVVNYGYHLDANKFAQLLMQHATTQLGVVHVRDHIDGVIGAADQPIVALQGRNGRIDGDFFVDCSGFAARLIGQHYGVELTPCGHALANDSAIAIQAPYVSDDTEISSVTHSSAQAEGWIWDIGLPTRKGVGYVFSSAHCDEDTARQTLAAYLAADNKTRALDVADARRINFKPGYRQTLWRHNCVAIGTSAGFLEPLEASALVMVELASSHLAEQMPRTLAQCPAAARQFNQAFAARWQRIIDFLKLHYVLSERSSDYWQDMRSPDSCSQQLTDWLSLWRSRSPLPSDFGLREEIFPTASYLYVLYGMASPTEFSQGQLMRVRSHDNHQALTQQERLIRQQLGGLPANRQLLRQLLTEG